MRTKSAAAESKEEAKYRALIDDCIDEIKEIHKKNLRQRVKVDQLRASTLRKMKETREILRRVEATL